MTEDTLPGMFKRLVESRSILGGLRAELQARHNATMQRAQHSETSYATNAERVAWAQAHALSVLLDYAERLGLFQYVPCGERFATPKEQAGGAYKAVLFRLPDAKDEP